MVGNVHCRCGGLLRSHPSDRRDPATILPERIAGALLTALDNENDSAIAAQIQATLQTLLRAGASAAPSYWLSVCSSVALSAPAAAPRVSVGGRQSGAGVHGCRGNTLGGETLRRPR